MNFNKHNNGSATQSFSQFIITEISYKNKTSAVALSNNYFEINLRFRNRSEWKLKEDIYQNEMYNTSGPPQ